jgi:hypothetical protein
MPISKYLKSFQQLLPFAISVGLSASIAIGAGPPPAATPSPFVSEVEAWAMLFQMMGRVHAAVEKRDSSSLDPEGLFAGTAVSSLLAELNKAPSSNNNRLRMQWLDYLRSLNAMHAAADLGQYETADPLMKATDEKFRQLQETARPELLKAAHQLAQRFTCPMHPDVVGSAGATCPKCGMALDQEVVVLPVSMANGNFSGQHTVIATISTDAPLAAGQPARGVLHLRRSNGDPVTLEQLVETHTRKIHLLIVDKSLTDYHHEHPQPTEVPGDYAFAFTPTKPGSYYAWADLRPTPLGLQEYDKTIIMGTGSSEPVADKQARLVADSQGFHFQLTLAKAELKARDPTAAKLTVTRNGKEFTQLEPVMGAFSHLVGFNEDGETVLHMHPTSGALLQESDRGGPVLDFKIYASTPGFTRLFAQVQINGRQVFAPFNIQVLP